MNSVARLIRARTSPIHARVEAKLDLSDAGLTTTRLFTVIRYFYGFWKGAEPAIDEWAEAHPVEAMALRWDRRRRADLFAADLATMGMSPSDRREVPRAPLVFERFGKAEVLGWLYVTEGSTLGGTVIDRHLRSRAGLDGINLHCFTPYSEGPGPMWQSFRAVLQAFPAGEMARTDAVVEAAVTTFESLERWLAPLTAGSPA